MSAWPVEEGVGGLGGGGGQALRALATSVKTKRLGLCVVPCEVVRVCGGHGTVSGAEARPPRIPGASPGFPLIWTSQREDGVIRLFTGSCCVFSSFFFGRGGG